VGAGLLTERPALAHAIARGVGTPAYVYDATAIRRQYVALDDALQPVPHRIHYSVKANSNLAILGLLRRLGAGVDIVSGGELVRVLRAGFAPGDIVFSGVGKTAAELARALDAGVGVVHVESPAELEALEETARERGVVAPFGIRVNPDVASSTHPYTQTGDKDRKFGVPHGEVVSLARWGLERPAVELVGVGMHIGSQIEDAGPYRVGAKRLADLVARLRSEGVTTLRHVDVGGGLGISYLHEPALSPEAFAAAVRPLAETTNLPLVVEPGRFLVGNAGVLLTRCLYRKRAGEKDFVIVDAGMNDLLRPSLYGAGHDVQIVRPDDGQRTGTGQGTAAQARADVVGPLCESGDFLALDRQLPGAAPGTLLAILGAGAYGFSMSSSYNSRPRPAEVLVDGDQWAVVRERETLEDLMRGEHTMEELDGGGWRAER
jgi:diaminopimelate decarboxylase